MTTYNPYTSRQRHRRAQAPQGMSAMDFLKCVGITAVAMLLYFAAALL